MKTKLPKQPKKTQTPKTGEQGKQKRVRQRGAGDVMPKGMGFGSKFKGGY